MSLAFAKPRAARDRQYLAFVRQHACALCGKRWQIETAHWGAHSLGSKASDYQVIPLCRADHRKQGAMDSALFEERYHINPARISLELLSEWHEMQMEKWREAERRLVGK